MIALANRRRLGMTGVLLLVVSLVTVVGLPALAHDGVVIADCNGLHVELTLFSTRGPNSVTVTVDGTVVAHVADFGRDYTLDHPWDPEVDHTYTVVAIAWDDPDGSKGFSKSFQGSVTACPVTTSTGSTTTGSTTTTSDTTTTTSGTTTTTSGTTTTTSGTTTTGSTSTTAAVTTTTGGTPTTAATTTTTEATTTTTAATTTTGETEVLGIQVSAPQTPQVATQQTLPFTGMSGGSLAMLASAIAGIGLLLLLASRQPQEKSPVRSWR